MRLEVGAARDTARLQQRRLAQALFGGVVGRGQIPHFQIQTGEIHRNRAQVGMIPDGVCQIARPKEAGERGAILKREQLASPRAHEIAHGRQPVAATNGFAIALQIQGIGGAEVSGLAQTQRVLLNFKGGLIPPRARVRRSRRDDRRGA